MIMKNTLALLAALLLVSVATVTAVGTETNTAPVERKFQVLPRDLTGVVVSFDAQRGELAVRHRPTGYIMKLRVGNNARFSIWRQVDLDELPDNQPFGGWGPIDEKNKVFRSGIFHVQTDSPNLKLGISGNSLTGRLQRRPVSEQSNGLTTRDGKSELRLFDGQSAWA